MKKVSIHPVIVKSKVLTDGSHKVRLSVSHNCETRYINTSIIVPSEKNIKRGEVVGLPNSAALNRKLRTQVNELYDLCDTIHGLEYISCAELIEILTKGNVRVPYTFEEISKEWMESKINIKDSSIDMYNICIKAFINFVGENFNLSLLTPAKINKYHSHLKSKGLSQSTIKERIGEIRCICRFATDKRAYFRYRIDPFIDYVAPKSTMRKVSLSVDELRAFRSYRFEKRTHRFAQSFFMLSFFMGGMNAVDILKTDFSKSHVKYKRAKTENRISSDSWTEFSIPKEAKMIIKSGQVPLNDKLTAKKVIRRLQYSLDTMRKMAIPSCTRLIYYSARKTFAQIAAELGFSDAVIEYCIGDQHSVSKPIDYYRCVTKEMADDAIRIILDFVDSDKDVKTFKKERGLI